MRERPASLRRQDRPPQLKRNPVGGSPVLHISGARALAVSVVGIALGWFISASEATTLAHYQGLSHDALMSELASKYDSKVTTSIVGALFLVLLVVIAVDLLTKLFERIWARLGNSAAAPKGA